MPPRRKPNAVPRTLNLRAFDIAGVHPSASWIVIGKPGSGKSAFAQDFAYIHRSRYPVAKIVSGTENETGFFAQNFPPLYISSKYNESEEMTYISRQKKVKKDKNCKNPLSLHIIDDSSDKPEQYRSPIMRAYFKNGSRHWEHAFMLLLQYCIDIPPDSRKCASYFVLFNEESSVEREKLYKNFASHLGTFQEFCDIMDQVCTEYTALVIDNRSTSKNLEDRVFYYKTLFPRPAFKFGCKEYRKFSKKRYNKNYEAPLI